jgi:PIN domain nuclease of toxin-antitoxin system
LKLLLDTCTFIWLATGDHALSADARAVFADDGNDAFLSAVSAWEIAVKNLLGGLRLSEPPERFVPKYRTVHRIESLSLNEEMVLQVRTLPGVHRDPFDRMLVCQAITEGMVILTPDELIRQYPVKTIW